MSNGGAMSKRRPVVLCVLDGFGERAEREANAIRLAETPVLDALAAAYPRTTLAASGAAVGLPDGAVGHGEIGHMTLGAGRVIQGDRARIDECLRLRRLSWVKSIDLSMRICMYDSSRAHLLGLLSDGGVHSHMDHLLALIDTYTFNEIPVVIHAFLDGRDTHPRSATNYLDRLQAHIEGRNAVIGTVSGRHYAMDGDGRWDRVYRAFQAIVRDKQLGPGAPRAESPWDAVSNGYRHGHDDEFIDPTRIGEYEGVQGDYLCDFASGEKIWEWTGLEVGMAFNFRGDRTRQLVGMLTRRGVPDYVTHDLLMDRHFPVLAFRPECFSTMTSYGEDTGLSVAFPQQVTDKTLGEVLAEKGLKQLRCAESEKAAHVTHFFSGGRVEPFAGEARKLVSSPKLVDTYDQKPEMSAAAVVDAAIAGLESGEPDFILVNLANGDMVGHSGKLKAAIEAVQAVDAHLGRLAEAVKKVGGALVITADHGNCETMVDAKGQLLTAHTANPVPFLLVDEESRGSSLRAGGSLTDVAPTILELMGIEAPAEMTGRSLRTAKS
jgi:2,3-bisphosphoglycerate-independent phosphoglycerate mutase